jgi:AraC family transcriptional regulator
MDLAKVFARTFPASQRLEWPERKVARVCVVMDGHFTEQLGHGVTFSRGDVVYRPAESRPPIAFGPSGMRSVTIELQPEAEQHLRQTDVLPAQALSFRSPRCLALATRIVEERVCRDSGSQLVARGLLLELLGEIGQCKAANPRLCAPAWLRKIHSTVSIEFAAPRTLVEYGELASVHPNHLMRAFRAHYGLSIGDHIRNCRLHHAAMMIVSSASGLAEIAVTSGFADHSHMTNTFRRHLGVSPSEYCRLARGSDLLRRNVRQS